MSAEFNQIDQELEEVKANVDELGKKMADTTPLVNIKESLKRIKSEIKQMDLRIGMLMHTIMQNKMQNTRRGGSQQHPSMHPDLEFDSMYL